MVTMASGVATFSNLAEIVAGPISLSFSGGRLTAGPSALAVSAAAPAKLVIQTQPSSTATAGQAFATQPVVIEEDQFGNIESGDSSTTVTASLASGAGPLQGTLAATLSKGAATFTNLGDSAAETIALRFIAGSLTSATSAPIQVAPPNSPPPNPTPTILGATVVMTPKTKKKKATFSGFNIQYSIPMNQTRVTSNANYLLMATVKGTKQKAVGFSATYNPSNNSVTLKVNGKNLFAKGGQLTILSSPPNGVSSAAGVYLSSSSLSFTISPNAKSITHA
jgi:hypothetical protein